MNKYIIGYRKESMTFFISSTTIDADSMEDALKKFLTQYSETPEYIKLVR